MGFDVLKYRPRGVALVVWHQVKGCVLSDTATQVIWRNIVIMTFNAAPTK